MNREGDKGEESGNEYRDNNNEKIFKYKSHSVQKERIGRGRKS